MARPSKEDILISIHEEAMNEFDTIQSALRDERLQCLKDRRFYSIAGAQWEGDLARQFENKPKFEVNKIHLAVIRIINEYRNNRITVDFISKEGVEYDDLADTCDDLYRADEQDSGAEEAYDNAFEEAVGGGFGAWRLCTNYENEEDEEDETQRIRIEPIFDADSSVFFDLNAKRQDKADAKRCFVITAMSVQSYKNEYEDDPASWPKAVHQYEFDWLTPDVVYIAEYYRIEEKKQTIRIFETIAGEEERYTNEDFDNDETLEQRLASVGTKEVRQKKIKVKRCHKYILNGNSVLEDCGYIAGNCIPIVPVYGKRWFIDNVERCMGQVRLATDAQRLKNMQMSKLAEISAYSSVEKPIFTPEQIAGHGVMWAEDNTKNYPYLLINPVTTADGQSVPQGAVDYTRSPQIPPAMAALLQITETDIQDILGNQQSGDQIVSNISGKAVEMIQNRLDMQTFIYMSNMAKAIRRSGEIWLSMARDVYVEKERKMKGIGSQEEMKSIELMRPIIDESGEIKYQNDLSEAKFDVTVTVGASSSSKRAATVRALTGMMQITQDPETMQVLGAMAMMNMEGEGIADVREYFRKKLVQMGVIKPNEEEQKQIEAAQANPKADPQEVYLQALAQEASANAMESQANTMLTQAKIDKTNADTAKIITDIDATEQKQALEIIEKFTQDTQPIEQIDAVVINPQDVQ